MQETAAKTPSRKVASIHRGEPLARRAVLLIRDLKDGEDGVTMVEYALVLALVAVACLVTVTQLVSAISGAYQRVATALH